MIALLAAVGFSCAQIQEIITRTYRSPDLTEADRAELAAVLMEESGCAVAADFQQVS